MIVMRSSHSSSFKGLSLWTKPVDQNIEQKHERRTRSFGKKSIKTCQFSIRNATNYSFISPTIQTHHSYCFSFSSAAATILAISTWHARFRTSVVQPKTVLARPSRGKSSLRPFQTGSFCFNNLYFIINFAPWLQTKLENEMKFDDEKIIIF